VPARLLPLNRGFKGGTVVMYQAFRQRRTCTPTSANCPLIWKLGSRRS